MKLLIRMLQVNTSFRLSVLLITASVIIGFGCAGQPVNPPKPELVEEKLISSSAEKRPDWLIHEPEIKDGNFLFVGLSDKKVLERDARDEAYRHAINNVVRYINVDVKDKFERIVTSSGLSSEVIDPTKVIRNFEEQLSSAVARRVKASEWYTERWERKQGAESTSYYMVCVLATTPQAEINKVIAEQQKYQAELIATAKSAQEQLGAAKLLTLDADNQNASAPVQAMTKYREIISRAEKVKASIQGYPELASINPQADEISDSAYKKIKSLIKNPEALFIAGIISLAKSPEKPITVAVARSTYQETDLSSEFGSYLIEKIEGVMTKESSIFNVISQKVFQDELKKGQIPIADCVLGRFNSEKQPVIAQLKGLIFARYWEKPDSIEIKLELLEVGKGTLLGADSVELPRDILPAGLAYKPANDKIAEEGMRAFGDVSTSTGNSNLKVKVWADKGEGSVYKKDEIIRFHFRASMDCYVYLYHMDAQGQVNLLFPNGFNKNNFVKANQVYTIPDETWNFDLQITPPFGAEMVKAVASLQPLKDIDIKQGEEGFKNIGNVTDANVRGIMARSIQAVPKEARAENTCTVTTIK